MEAYKIKPPLHSRESNSERTYQENYQEKNKYITNYLNLTNLLSDNKILDVASAFTGFQKT